MLIVDSHVHIALHMYEPVEILLAQMEHNQVEKTVLVQSSTTVDNTYVIESMRRFPGRFSVVCRVDVDSPNALNDLERWAGEGAESIRLRNFQRSPGDDPLAIWRKAESLGMSVSVGGPTDVFASTDFADLAEALPGLKIVIEHLGGVGVWAVGETQRPEPPYAQYRQMLELARFPNTYVKIHGIGEICPPPFPYQDIPPFMDMAYEAFGPERMTWGSDYPPVSLREGYSNALRYPPQPMPFASQADLAVIFRTTPLSLRQFP